MRNIGLALSTRDISGVSRGYYDWRRRRTGGPASIVRIQDCLFIVRNSVQHRAKRRNSLTSWIVSRSDGITMHPEAQGNHNGLPEHVPIQRAHQRVTNPLSARFPLPARPRSADRTRSQAAVSRKREYFKCLPETGGYFALTMPKIGAWRLVANSQKPAIGGPFCEYQGHVLWAPDCLAVAGAATFRRTKQ